MYGSSIHTHISSALAILIQGSSQAETTDTLHWWQIATGVIGVPTAIVGLYVAWLTSQKIRLETRNVQLDVLKKEGILPEEAQSIPRSQDLIGSPQVLAAGIQDFLQTSS